MDISTISQTAQAQQSPPSLSRVDQLYLCRVYGVPERQTLLLALLLHKTFHYKKFVLWLYAVPPSVINLTNN